MQYTVTMFVVDVSPSMGRTREVELEDGMTGQTRVVEMTNLEWSLRYVKLKIQEMVRALHVRARLCLTAAYSDIQRTQDGPVRCHPLRHGRCVAAARMVLTSRRADTALPADTSNVLNAKHGGYDHVTEFIEIGQPSATTLAELSGIAPTVVDEDADAFSADRKFPALVALVWAEATLPAAMDAIIVAIEAQEAHLERKRTWTRKLVLITDAERPMELEEWEAIASKINEYAVSTLIVYASDTEFRARRRSLICAHSGVDFDSEEFGFHEEDKSKMKVNRAAESVTAAT